MVTPGWNIALKGDNLDLEIITKISFQLNEESSLPYKFDLISYNSIKTPELKDHIDRVGIRIV